MNEIKRALIVVKELKEEWYPEPTERMTGYRVKKEILDLMSYQRWAIKEVEFELLRHQKEHPLTVLERFEYMINDRVVNTKSPTVNYVFSILLDVTRDVREVIQASI